MLSVNIQHAVAGFNLAIQADFKDQAVTVIFGPSGSGKTTLLDLIAGFRVADKADKISFNSHRWQSDGKTLQAIEDRRIGYVRQKPCLFEHLSVANNIAYAQERAPQNHNHASHINYDFIIEALDLSTLLSKYPQQLSGGELQRVAIARALAARPQLLLFDEPVSALDEHSREKILGSIEQIRSAIDVPMLYVTHNLNELLRLADQAMLLDQGRVLAHDNIDKLLTDFNLPLHIQSNAGLVLTVSLTHADTQYNLYHTRTSDGTPFIVSAPDAAHSKPAGLTMRLRIYAKDVSLTLSKARDSSILNILPATIEQFVELNASQIMVKLRFREQRLLALITRQSASKMDLTLGKKVYAQIKSIAVLSSASSA